MWCISASSGHVLWHVRLDHAEVLRTIEYTLDGASIAVSFTENMYDSNEKHLELYASATGQLQHTFDTSHEVVAFAVVQHGDVPVIVAASQDWLTSFDRNTRKLLWRRKLGRSTPFRSGVHITNGIVEIVGFPHDGSILTLDCKGRLVCRDCNSGLIRWDLALGKPPARGRALAVATSERL